MGLYEKALAAFRSGATYEAASLAEELVSTSQASGDLSGEIDGLCVLARIALRQGDFQRVALLGGKGRELALRNNEARLERMPLHLEAVAARMKGDFRTARELYRESINLNRQLGEDRMVAAEHRNLAYVEFHDGKVPEARELFSSSASLARACGYDALEPYLLLDSAVLAFDQGDLAEAGQLLEETKERLAAAGQVLDPDDAAEAEWLRKHLEAPLDA